MRPTNLESCIFSIKKGMLNGEDQKENKSRK